jgi:hypothetical protein
MVNRFQWMGPEAQQTAKVASIWTMVHKKNLRMTTARKHLESHKMPASIATINGLQGVLQVNVIPHAADPGILLDLVGRKCAVIFQLCAIEDQSLHFRKDTKIVTFTHRGLLDPLLQVVDRVSCLNIKLDDLSTLWLHTDAKRRLNQIERGIIWDLVVGDSPPRRLRHEMHNVHVDAKLVPESGFHVVDCLRSHDIHGDSVASGCLHINAPVPEYVCHVTIIAI